jgi:cell wall-associated NlpC family hydrolase
MSKLGIILAYSKSFVGLPYIWGGQHPSQGYDCSGLVQELLASVGFDPPGDQTAKTLYFTLSANQSCDASEPVAGSLLFFGTHLETISHVAFAIDDSHMIEAGGGGRNTIDVKSAIARQAFVRVRPISSRKDLIACLLPKY